MSATITHVDAEGRIVSQIYDPDYEIDLPPRFSTFLAGILLIVAGVLWLIVVVL